jgi:hypothetical protein
VLSSCCQGVRWLVGLCEKGLNGILADDMGLGKTVQVGACGLKVTTAYTAQPLPLRQELIHARLTCACLSKSHSVVS